jgi:hypothetical protein
MSPSTAGGLLTLVVVIVGVGTALIIIGVAS